MEDLWLFVLVLVNTFVLFVFYKMNFKGQAVQRKWYFVKLDGVGDFISVISKDFIVSVVLYRLGILCKIDSCDTWISLFILHILADVCIIIIYLRCKKQELKSN